MSVSIVWRRLDRPGHDSCTLRRFRQSWLLDGVSIWHDPAGPARLSYLIRCDADWRARSAHLIGRVGETVLDLQIARGSDGIWGMNGKALSGSDSATDFDLGFTPATNTLVLRRLMHEGKEQDQQVAVWLDESDWQPKLLTQSYRREADERWHFESARGDAQAALSVDHCGFVTDYPGFWKQEG